MRTITSKRNNIRNNEQIVKSLANLVALDLQRVWEPYAHFAKYKFIKRVMLDKMFKCNLARVETFA